MVEHDEDRSVALAPGVPYAYAAGTTTARPLLVFTAGACPLDGSGATVAPGDVAAQARVTMENLHQALLAAGADLGGVIKTTVFVASSDRAGVTVLGYPDQLVEVEAVAARSA